MFCYLPQKVSTQISRVRGEIATLQKTYRNSRLPWYKPMSVEVYYDQLEELNAHLSKLKTKQAMEDSLERWCEKNPSDMECKVYDV